MAHSQFSVVTERATFAMPETAIGFVPDAGLALIFRQLQSNLGMYLGLTGARLKGKAISLSQIGYMSSVTKFGGIFLPG